MKLFSGKIVGGKDQMQITNMRKLFLMLFLIDFSLGGNHKSDKRKITTRISRFMMAIKNVADEMNLNNCFCYLNFIVYHFWALKKEK